MSTAAGSRRPWAPDAASGAAVKASSGAGTHNSPGTRAEGTCGAGARCHPSTVAPGVGAGAGMAGAPGHRAAPGAGAEDETLAVELAVGHMLRAGVAVAAVLVLAGLALLVPGLQPVWGRSLATLGLAVLVLTPVARVVAALWVFVRERDVPYTVFCLVVLAALAAGMLLGKAE